VKEKMKIMLIDDDLASLLLLAAFIRRLGHSCETFSLPAKAVQAYVEANKETPYDLVITDLKMPVMDGMQVLQEILSCHPGAKVVINTGFNDLEAAYLARQKGATAYLHKPLNPAAIIEVIEGIEGEKH